ncbi:MAG: hypothetical protein WBC51_06415 [Vicinamibacterales bacterium]
MTRRRSLAAPLAVLFIGVGILFSGSLLEWVIFPSGTIVGTARRELALNIVRGLAIAGGLYLALRRPRLTVIHLAAAALGAAFAAILGALVLQVGYNPPPLASGWKAFAPSHEWNELGFRGRRITYTPEDYVVLLLGDSQVEATAVRLDEMPEQRLEAHLKSVGRSARVFSVGAGAYGQDQELLALQQYFTKYRADLVILWQTPVNDIWNNVFKTHMASRNPKPTFWLDASQNLCGPSEQLGQPLANSPIVVVSMWQRLFGLPWRDKSWENALPEPYTPLSSYDGSVRTEWQERWKTNAGRMRDENLATEKSHLAVALSPRSKRMQYGIDLTHALVRRINEVVNAQGGKLVIFQVENEELVPQGEDVYALNGKYYRVSRRQYYGNWSAVNQGFDTVTVPVTVRDWRVGPTDAHLNAQATNQVMRDLAVQLGARISEAGHDPGCCPAMSR